MNAVLKLQKVYDFWNSMWSGWEKTANQFFTKPGLPIKEAARCEAMATSLNNLHIASAHSTCQFGQWESSKVRRKLHKQIWSRRHRRRESKKEDWQKQNEKDKIWQIWITWKREIGKMKEIGSKWRKGYGRKIKKPRWYYMLVLAMVLKFLNFCCVNLPLLTDLSVRELPFMLQHFSCDIEDGSCRLVIDP